VAKVDRESEFIQIGEDKQGYIGYAGDKINIALPAQLNNARITTTLRNANSFIPTIRSNSRYKYQKLRIVSNVQFIKFIGWVAVL
jgi:hypothetical protein